MQDILKQIQSLKEDFMNLIEVEGLGQPASDVPPSPNKIKKDVKTKNGKVELVSVEDELFPKDGNAKEQFRQKVIDTINGMIQGTATLEDLMQVVRAKKNGFVKEGFEGAIAKMNKSKSLKEALKILEGWAKDKRPEAAKKSLKSRREEHFRALGNALDAADVYGADNCEQEVKDANRAAVRVAHAENVMANESLEKGITILEEIINEYNIDKVKATLDKRTEQSMKADDEESKEYYNILNMKDKDKRAEAYKQFLKKSDKRLNDENKKFDLYVKYAKKYPELVEALTLIHELFDGPDLIDDDIVGQKGFTKKLIRKGTTGAIKAVGHGIQKAVDRKSCSEDFDKNEEKEYNECKALQLWEQVINEIEDRFYRKVLNKSEKEQEDAEKMKDLATTKKSKDAIDDVLIPRRHRHEVVNSKFEDKVVKRAEDEYKNSKKKKGK